MISIPFLYNILFVHSLTAQSLAPTDCWNIQYNSQKQMRVYMLGSVKNGDGKEISALRSENFILKSGNNILSNENIKTTKLKYLDDDAEKAMLSTGNFPLGNYTLCTKIIDASNNQEIKIICRSEAVTGLLHNKNEQKIQNNFGYFGSASVDFISVSPQAYYTELPTSYARIEAEQGISLYAFPIAGQFRYTTTKADAYQDVDMFTLRFDRDRFQRQVKELVIRKVAESQLKKVMANAGDLKDLTELKSLEKKFKSAAYTKLNEEIQSIGSELNNMKDLGPMSAAKQYREELKVKYAKLQAQKRKYDELKKRYEELQKLNETWIKSGRLKELESMVYNPPDLSDPKIVVHHLKQYGAFKGMNKFMYGIQDLSIGACFPVYSPLTLNGTQIFGASVEWNPGVFYLAASGGTVSTALALNIDTSLAHYKQKLAAVRLGLGKSYGTHISFNALHYWDQQKSIDVPTVQELFPESSWIGSTDLALSFGRNRIIEINGEIALLYKNQNTLDTFSYPLNAIGSSVLSSVNPNISSSIDFAYNASTALNLFNHHTRLLVNQSFVGPGYVHPGTLGLSNDLLRQEAKLSQDFLKNKMTISAFINIDKDNFSNAKGSQTDRNTYGIESDIRTKWINQFNLRISQINIQNALYYYKANSAQMSLNKAYSLGSNASANSNLVSMFYRTHTDSLSSDLNSINLFLQQSLTLYKSWSMQLGAQYAKNTVGIIQQANSGVNFSLGKLFFKKIKLTLGTTYNASVESNKLGYTVDIRGAIIKNMSISIKANKNQYSSFPNQIGSYQDQLIQAGIKYNW